MCAHAAFDLAAVAIIYWNLEAAVAHLVIQVAAMTAKKSNQTMQPTAGRFDANLFKMTSALPLQIKLALPKRWLILFSLGGAIPELLLCNRAESLRRSCMLRIWLRRSGFITRRLG